MVDYSGKTIAHFHVIEKLGQGGMASVYRAYDTRLDRDVAIKVVRKETIPPEQLERIMQRFVREAKALAKFIHPNIVPIHDFGELDGAPYLVMAYLPGGTLKNVIGRPVAPDQAVRWLAPIADALAYAHRRGVIHRDVKPGNILITEEGVPMLSDFGIAQLLEDNTTQLTGTGLGVGTPEYMAPEQWQGKAVEATDQYALGVVLYELLTGQKPYMADTPVAIALKQMNDPLPRPSAVVNGIPESVEKVLFKALAKDPADRYADMGAFGKALGALDLTPGQAPAPERMESRKAAQATTAPAAPPKVDSEGATVDALEGPSASSSTSGKKKVPGWLWGFGAAVVVLLILLVVFWPQGGEKVPPVAQATDVPVLVESEETTVPNPTNTKTAIPDPTNTRTAAPTQTSTTVPTATESLGIGSTKVNPVDGAEMVYVPAGDFLMGTSDEEIDWILDQSWCSDCIRDWFEDEQPQHTVYLDDYWIYKHEVTNEKYASFLNAMGNQNEEGANWLDAGDGDVRIFMIGGKWVAEIGYGNYPVVEVSWYGAQAYCEWVGGGLPTEAEWEKAARGTDGRRYPWGDESPTCSLVQYYRCGDTAVPVGSFPEGISPFGALDMAGNVWEWVKDLYSSNRHVRRGGAWYGTESALRVSNRNSYFSVFPENDTGFRCRLSEAP